MADAVSDSTSYEINALVLISSIGLTTDIKFMVQDLNIYEDFFSNVMSGDLVIKDSQDVFGAFKMHGNEFLYIKLVTPSLQAFEKYFRVYKVSDMALNNLNAYTYKIYFCSEEFVLNQQKLISKSYKNMTNSDIVRDIVINGLGVKPEKFLDKNIENTKNVQNLIVPYYRPFEAINWISSFSLNDNLSSAFFFYETHEGFNFKSLRTIYEQAPYKQITINPKNLNDEKDKEVSNRFIPDRYDIKQPFDMLELIATGGVSGRMLAIDVLTQTRANRWFNPVRNNLVKMNEFVPFNEATNRFEDLLPDGVSFVRYFNAFQGNLVDKWLLQRAAQVSLLNSFRMNLQLSGDSQMTVGMMLDIDVPKLKPITTSEESQQDGQKSGKFLVTQVRHRIVNNKYLNYIEVCKDSNKEAVPAFSKNNNIYEIAKKS